MKTLKICLLSFAMIQFLMASQAATTFTGDGGDTPLTLEAFEDPPGPTILPSGGNPGGVLVLTESVNSQNNFASFDMSDVGFYASSTFTFDFLINPGTSSLGSSADGFSFVYADTSLYGTSGGLGAAPYVPEDPALARGLGIGFDTWNNQFPYDDPNQPYGDDYQEISVFWNGALVNWIPDTRQLPVPLTLDDAGWHTVMGTVDFAGATLDLSIDGNVILAGLPISGLAPFESRIIFAGRTGAANELALMDNLNVQYYVPEPSTGVMTLILATTCISFQRRRQRG